MPTRKHQIETQNAIWVDKPLHKKLNHMNIELELKTYNNLIEMLYDFYIQNRSYTLVLEDEKNENNVI